MKNLNLKTTSAVWFLSLSLIIYCVIYCVGCTFKKSEHPLTLAETIVEKYKEQSK